MKEYKVQFGFSFDKPTFFVDGDAISIKKCLVGLQEAYLISCKYYADSYFNSTQTTLICQLLAKIVKNYPFAQKEIFLQLQKSYPHHSCAYEHLVIY